MKEIIKFLKEWFAEQGHLPTVASASGVLLMGKFDCIIYEPGELMPYHKTVATGTLSNLISCGKQKDHLDRSPTWRVSLSHNVSLNTKMIKSFCVSDPEFFEQMEEFLNRVNFNGS